MVVVLGGENQVAEAISEYQYIFRHSLQTSYGKRASYLMWCVSDISESNLSNFSLVDIEYSDLEFKEKVGSGGFGTVSKGRWISKNKIVAIKMLMDVEEREVILLGYWLGVQGRCSC